MGIIGIGIDIVKTIRIKKILLKFKKKFLNRILSPAELIQYKNHYNKVAFLSKCFAVKEAASKALGTGIKNGVSFIQFEINHNIYGKPILQLSNKASKLSKILGINNIFVTITDEYNYVIAIVVFEK